MERRLPSRPRPRPAAVESANGALRRELYFFNLYRALEAALLALMVFGPAGTLIGAPRDAAMGETLAVTYLVFALGVLVHGRQGGAVLPQTLVGVTFDIVVATLATHALPASAGPGIAMMLLFNVAAASLLLRLRLGMAVAGFAAAALVGEYVWSTLSVDGTDRPLAELLMFSVSYMSVAMLTNQLGKQMRATQALADQRGAEAANLAEVNELIIRRMRTGVLLVDGDGRMRLANEAALLLLGDLGEGQRNLSRAAPELARRLETWLQDGKQDETAMAFGSEQTDVLPRFARLRANSNTSLIFLDDTSLVSRRAESLTLTAMGRFSASLAHEIRNPLAAISYATQLLEESKNMDVGDRRLLQIVHQQCMRTNAIVESVLGIARRERAIAEHIDLVQFVRQFVEDYKQTMPVEKDVLRTGGPLPALPALVDPRHLQQILTVLVQNALNYGRMPGEPARVTVHVHELDDVPVIDVSDRGPGVPDAVATQLFRPFFTTSEHGTGLGLYIARELCRANEATLEYVSVPAGGGCFRITLAGRHVLLPA
jgi:two-component system sensor histidine kinase PilS (NtrC family)